MNIGTVWTQTDSTCCEDVKSSLEELEPFAVS